MFKKIILLLLVIFIQSLLIGVEVRSKTLESFSDFQKGVFNGIVLKSKGQLLIGKNAKQIKGPLESFYLSAYKDKISLLLGTGHSGRVFSIKGKEIKKIMELKEPDIYAVLRKSNGKIYAASSPNGKIYSLNNDKKVDVFYKFKAQYIWDMKEDSKGNLVCATGNPGQVNLVNFDKQGKIIFKSQESHILSLHISKDNTIYAGGGEKGILYRIRNKKVEVVFETPFKEIFSICEDNKGNIYFTAGDKDFNKLKKPSLSKNVQKGKLNNKEKLNMLFSNIYNKRNIERSAVYCLSPKGNVEKIWHSSSEDALSLLFVKKENCVLLSTGGKGRVYKLSSKGDYSLYHEVESVQAYKLIGSETGEIYMLGNNAPAITNLNSGDMTSSYYLSEVFDLGVKSKLGRITWNCPVGAVSVFVKAGNSKEVDNTWSNWSAPLQDPLNSKINFNNYRYVRLKINFSNSPKAKGTILDKIKFYYIQKNKKPKIENISTTSLSQKDILKKTFKTLRKNNKEKFIQINWIADDENDDELSFNLYLKDKKESKFFIVAKNIKEKKFLLDTRMYSDGIYQAKVEVSDILSNNISDVMKDELVSPYFYIDSTAPKLLSSSIEGEYLKVIYKDDVSPINSLHYSYDGKSWFVVFPNDGIGDSLKEDFKIKLSKGKSDYIFLKVQDEAGNFKIVQRKF